MHYSDIGVLSEKIRNKELSVVELCEQILARIEKYDPTLDSFVDVDVEGARRAAAAAEEEISRGEWRGPLHGIPLAVKDLYSLGDAPTSFGSGHLDEYRLDEEATAVRRLRDAGAVIVGRLRMSEAALTDHGPGLPTPLNPWNAEIWTGTSSSGCASATSAGLCFGSLGSDTGGSVRGPATATALSGLKPTRGVISANGAIPLSRTLDTVGSFARSARDCRILFEAIADEPLASSSITVANLTASSLKIGVDASLLESVDPQIQEMIERTAEVFAEIGAEIVAVEVPDGSPLAAQWVDFVGIEAVEDLSELYPEDKRDLYGPEIAYVLEQGRGVTPERLAEMRATTKAYTEALDEVLTRVGAVLLPTIGVPAPSNAQIAEMRLDYATWNQQLMRLTAPFNFSGHPSMTFPTGFTSDGNPLGAQLVSAHNADQLLLTLAEMYQNVTAHHLQRPAQFP